MNNLGKNIVIVLALLGAGFFLAFIRFRPHLEDATSWTDGEKVYQDKRPEDIRYALWEDPEAFDSRINSAEDELRPALSPDGQFLVFASGQRGLNQDLYISEVINGEPQEPRPLFEVNTAFDETSPAFSNDALYFASNRDGGAGGFDLWKVSYQNGTFGRPEHLEGSLLNTTADEMDPAPVPGQLALAFSSDRPRGARNDFDLYIAQAVGASGLLASPMTHLNTPFDEREPAFIGDARTLVYASNNIEGSKGGYDLWRSVRDRGIWLPPENQGGLNSEADERGPAPSPDGFSLVYYVQGAEDSADLFRARSRELFRMPGRPVGWLDFVILGSLVLLAVLAWLAKRWKAVDLLYKCFMIAMIIHLLMLWSFQKVYPEPGEMDLPERETMFKVRLAVAPSHTSAANREFGGAIEAARSEVAELNAPDRAEMEVSEATESYEAAPERSMVRSETAPSAATPERTSVQLEHTETAKPTEVAQADLAAPTETFEKRESAAASMSVAVAEDFKVDRAEVAVAAPTRAEIQTDPTEEAAAMVQRGQRRVTREVEAAPSFAPSAAEMMAVGSFGDPVESTTPVEVAQSSETVERIHSNAPTFEVAQSDPTAEFRPTVRDADAPQRQSVRPAHTADGELDSQPTFEPGAGLERAEGGFQSETALAVAAPTRQGSEFQPDRVTAHASESELNLQAPPDALSETGVELGSKGTEARPSVEETLIADLGAESTAQRVETESNAPSRLANTESSSEDPLSEFGVSLSASQLTVKRPDRTSRTAGPKRNLSEFMPDAASPNSLPEIALSDEVKLPLADTEGNPAEETDVFESTLLAGVTSADGPKNRFGDLVGPVKDMLEMAAPDLSAALGPDFTPLVAMKEIAPDEPEITQEPSEMEHTPYRNRFGVQKDIALEEHGGSVETEAAVQAGLEYLASLQNDAGFWGSRSDRQDKYRHVVVGKTGLSLLAFLGAGHTPDSETTYSATAANAVNFLLNVQDPQTGHFGDTASYGHGIATYALAECYALTKKPELLQPLEAAVKWIVQKQHRSMDPKLDGGWGYYFPDGDGYQNDRWPRVSVSSWQIMALESARIGGLYVPDDTFERARKFLRGSVDPRFGWVRYSHNPSRLSSSYPTLPASTPACLFAAALLGEDINSDYYKDARRYTLQRVPRSYSYKGDDAFVQRAEGNLYFWYYGSLAMFRVGGETWERWNGDMKKTLIDSQGSDGSWKPISIYARYAGDDWRDKSYSTAMCVLTLEVYYRYFTPLMSVKGGPGE